MERNQNSCEITMNGDAIANHHDEGFCSLKKEISSHSLYALLLQSHSNCLKVCVGDMENVIINPPPSLQQANSFPADKSELDQFMEAYCVALNKLKEAMEESQQESMAFINLMYSQLDDLPLENTES